jgi:hypothetical protein
MNLVSDPSPRGPGGPGAVLVLSRPPMIAVITAFLGSMVLGTPAVAGAQPAADLRFILLVDGSSRVDSSAFARGATLGFEEATRAADLIGRRITLDTAVWRAGEQPPAIGRADGIIAAVACERILEIDGAQAGGDRAAIFNVSCDADWIRERSCRGRIFHVAASEAMLRDASAEWYASNPADTRARGQLTSWHAALYRFGAEQLNDRFTARFNAPMHADAWAAWMAVKIAWETGARAGAGESLLVRLSAGRDRFDGHKGVPLDFRAWDRQLRQPLYVVQRVEEGDEPRITDVPSRGTGDVRAMLDRIGVSEHDSACSTVQR